MDEIFFKVFITVVGVVVFGLMGLAAHEVYKTLTYGPKYYCDEYEQVQTCDVEVQPVFTTNADGTITTTYVPVTVCRHRCLRSHKNPNRTDD